MSDSTRGSRADLRRAAAWLLLLCLGAFPAASEEEASASERESRPPVFLRGSLVLTPVEAAGTGLEPEAKIQVTIDARGEVSRVEVLEIRPPSDYDAYFKDALIEAISTWRYAPARVDGEPVATDLEWTVKFRPREKRGEGSRPLFLAEESYAEERAQILAMPLELRAKLLLTIADRATEQLQENPQRAESRRFLVFADGDPGMADLMARNFESTLIFLDRIFAEPIELQPEPYRWLVFVYSHRTAFESLRSAVGITYEWPASFYHPAGFLAFHREVATNEDLISVMMHEITHAYLDRFLVRPGVTSPRWLSEGLANYIGLSSVDRKGRLEPGKVEKSRFMLYPPFTSGATRAATQGGLHWKELQDAMRKGEGLSVAELLATEKDVFYGEKLRFYYGASLLLVHYLRHGGDGWEERFSKLLTYIVEGYPAAAVLEAVYGLSPAEMDEPFQEYVRAF